MSAKPPSSDDAETKPSSDDLEAEAVRWLVLLTGGEGTDDDVIAFLRWRDASDDNLIAISSMLEVWRSLGQIDCIGDIPRPELESRSIGDDDDEAPLQDGSGRSHFLN